MLRAVTILGAMLCAGAAEAGAALGVQVRMEIPALCAAEHAAGEGEITVACLHREGFVLLARNRREAGDLTVAIGRFRAVIPPGEARPIADSLGPTAARLPVALTVAGDAAAPGDLALEIERR
jgi:hypothetical protein